VRPLSLNRAQGSLRSAQEESRMSQGWQESGYEKDRDERERKRNGGSAPWG
jgi:hypothetical protein